MKLLPTRRKFCVHHTTMHHVTSCKATYVRCMWFSCNLPPEWQGSFTCYWGNTGVERIPKRMPSPQFTYSLKFLRFRQTYQERNEKVDQQTCKEAIVEPLAPKEQNLRSRYNLLWAFLYGHGINMNTEAWFGGVSDWFQGIRRPEVDHQLLGFGDV